MMVQKIKKTKRKNKLIPKKNDKLTDKWFIGPTTGQGPKKSNLEKRDLFWEKKPNIKPNPFIKTMVLSQIYATLKYIKKTEKEYTISSRTTKKWDLPCNSSALYFEGWGKYVRHRCSIKLFEN